jgi:RNA polymerase sigma factor (sigma-70 family)
MENNPADDFSIRLLAQWREGDPQAAGQLFQRYAERLTALARSRLSARMGRRFDPEDVVQSVYCSFFKAASEGRFDLQRGGDLWRLLVAITLNKLHLRMRRNQSGKRAIAKECPVENELYLGNHLVGAPSPLEAAALADELESIMAKLGPLERRMLEMRLQGYNLEEIAAATQRTERTVRRTLTEVRQMLGQKGGADAEP